jgi:hypothetical protein
MKIKVNRENPEGEEKGEGNPGTQSGFFYYQAKNPRSQEREENEDQCLGRERKIKIA